MGHRYLLVAAWAVCLSAAWADADQDVSILYPLDPDDPSIVIWRDGSCLGPLVAIACTLAKAKELDAAVQRAHRELGESVGDHEGRIRVEVTERLRNEKALGEYDSVGDLIRIKKTGSQVSTDSADHEMGHAFFDKHVTTHTGGSDDVLEHWGADEGFAKILAKKTIGQSHGSPTGGSVSEILGNWQKKKKQGDEVEDYEIAHDLGNLMATVYDRVKQSTNEARAFRLFRDAVADFDDMAQGNGSYVTFLEMFVNVLQEAADNENEEDAEEAVRAVAEAFRDVAGVTLPAPQIVDEDEGIDADDIRPDTWVPPLPWWFGDTSLFECRVVDVSNVRCVRRPDDRGDEGLPGAGRPFDPGGA